LRLAIEPDVPVVGKAGRAGEALAMDKALEPDLIVVDRGMQGACAANVVLRLRAAAPDPTTLALTLLGDDETHARALESGAQELQIWRSLRLAAGRPPTCAMPACGYRPLGEAVGSGQPASGLPGQRRLAQASHPVQADYPMTVAIPQVSQQFDQHLAHAEELGGGLWRQVAGARQSARGVSCR
jgi:CheY-like chemotaxis protein